MKPFHRWLLVFGSVSTGVTGVLYAWMKYFMTPQTEWAVINHPLQPWVLKSHILAAPILVFALGAIVHEHVVRQIRAGIAPGRRTGIAATVVTLPMVATGYLIQSVTHAGWLQAMVWGHLATSAVYLVFYGVHAWLMARRRGRRGTLVPLRRHRLPSTSAAGGPSAARAARVEARSEG
ncbi:MAG: hypothetical protein RLN75_06020 [Longimicrobiales bacterium]